MPLSGVILAIHWLTFFHAIQVSTVAIGLIGFATFPIFVTFLEPIMYRQKNSIHRRDQRLHGIGWFNIGGTQF